MAEKLISFFMSIFAGKMDSGILCFIISLFPILELRGGLLAASPAFLDVPLIRALPLCIIGNLLPIPFVLLLIEKIIILLERGKHTGRIAGWLRAKVDKNKAQIEKYGFWGLVLFVGIPLPGTGAWTGSLIASLLDVDIKKSSLAIFCGIIMATVIMYVVSYGVLGSLVH